jgi:hypothetical protein
MNFGNAKMRILAKAYYGVWLSVLFNARKSIRKIPGQARGDGGSSNDTASVLAMTRGRFFERKPVII